MDEVKKDTMLNMTTPEERAMKYGNDLKPQITKEQFDKFRNVQYGGKFNMYDPNARLMSGLDQSTYFDIMKKYEELQKLYGPYERAKKPGVK
jgi:hypothetical protein